LIVTSSDIARDRKRTVALAFGIVVVLVIVLQVVSLPEETRLWKEAFNFGHVLLFGALSILALWASTEIFHDGLRERYQHYLVALTVSVVVGAGTEILQRWVPRDANLADFARNVAGAVCFLGIYGARDARATEQWSAIGRTVKNTVIVGVTITLMATAMPFVIWAVAYVHRDHVFPEIVSFASPWSRLFVDLKSATLTMTSPPSGWTTAKDEQVAKLTLDIDSYPGFEVKEPYSDWSGYKLLRFVVYADKSVELVLRVNDRMHDNDYDDRYNHTLRVQPGANSYAISIDDIRHGPKHRELDTKDIAAVMLFAVEPKERYVIYADRFWLE
jgi:VanZ family protein